MQLILIEDTDADIAIPFSEVKSVTYNKSAEHIVIIGRENEEVYIHEKEYADYMDVLDKLNKGISFAINDGMGAQLPLFEKEGNCKFADLPPIERARARAKHGFHGFNWLQFTCACKKLANTGVNNE